MGDLDGVLDLDMDEANVSGAVDVDDILAVLAAWGPCE